MRRGALRWTGIGSLLVSLALLAGAASSLLVVGSDDAVESPAVRLRSDGVAIVAEDLRAETDLLAPRMLGRLDLVVRGPAEVFVGEAPPAVLDDYLAGAPYDAVVDLGPVPRTAFVPGGQQPPPPGTIDGWVRQSTGDPARLSLPVTPGTAVAIMRADARPGVEATLVVLLRLPGAWVAGWVALVLGLALLVLGVLLLRRSRRQGAPPRHSADTPMAVDVLPGASSPEAVGPVPPSATPDPPRVATPPAEDSG